jgi:hypothetical protein
MQHMHLELLWNLTYAFTKKNKHNSRINIYVNFKIVINSPEVCFKITRQYAIVGCKNLIMFSYKIIYADSAEMENKFYKQIYKITLCHFWYRR